MPILRIYPLHKIFCLFFTLAFSAVPLFARSEQALVFAGDKDYAPVIFLENGVPKGIYVDIIKAMHLPEYAVEIRLLEWNAAQQMVLSGKADVTMGLSITDARKKLFDFSDPVMAYEYAIFVKNTNTILHNFADLEGKLIAVTAGGLPRNVLEKNPKIRLQLVENSSAGLSLVQQGKVDALVADKWVGLYTIHQERLQGITPAPGDAVIMRQGAFGLRKGNPALIAAINTELARLKNSGKIDEILDHWSQQKVVYFTEERLRRLTLIALGGVLVVIFLLLIFWIFSLRKSLKKIREAEQRLSQNQEVFEKLTRQVPGLIYQFKMDPQGNFSIPYASDAIVALSGFTAEEAKADFSLLVRQIHKDDLAGFLDSIRRSAQNLTPWQHEYRAIMPDQRLRWRMGESKPEKMSDGSILWHGYISDTTDRKAIEEALRESEGFANAVTEYSPIGIIIFDKNGKGKMANRWLCHRLGSEAREFSGEDWLSFIHPDDRERALKAWVAFWMDKWPYALEYRMVAKDGKVILVNACAQTLQSGRELMGAVIIIQDITEQRASEAQIVQLSGDIIELREKERSEVSAELHDSIAQNLVLLKLQLQSKLKSILSDKQVIPKELLSPIDDAIATARAISHRLSPMHLESIGLQGAIEDLADQIKKIKDVNISVDIADFAESIPTALHIHVYRIVQEAVTNSLQHSNAGQIRIRATTASPHLSLTIEDNGVSEDLATEISWGTGLRLMRERARILGAEFYFKLTPTGAENRLVLGTSERSPAHS